MIAYVCPISSEERWDRYVAPALRRLAGADDRIVTDRGGGTLPERLNRALDELSPEESLEACVLLHDDVEIADPGFPGKIRDLFADPQVAVAGAVGAASVRNLAWWDGHPMMGGVRAPLMMSSAVRPATGKGSHVADAVDGLLLALSPWAVRTLRFDPSISGFHGYDTDICFQARSHGLKVVVEEFDLVHHSRGGTGDPEAWLEADYRFRRKWESPGRLWR